MTETPEQWLERYLDAEGDTFPPFVGTVTKSVVATDARFQNGQQLMLIWTMDLGAGEEPREQFWGIGKLSSGWLSQDGGKTFLNRDGKKIHPSCAYMRGVLVPCANWQLGADIDAAGGPYNAATWVGTSWEITSGTHDFGGNLGVQKVKTLTAYKGGFGGSSVAEEPFPATAPDPTDKFNPILATLTQTERAFLEEQARNGANLSDWAITNMPAKMSDAEFRAAIVDPEFSKALLATI